MCGEEHRSIVIAIHIESVSFGVRICLSDDSVICCVEDENTITIVGILSDDVVVIIVSNNCKFFAVGERLWFIFVIFDVLASEAREGIPVDDKVKSFCF